MTENLYGGKLAFKATMLHVHPAQEKETCPAGYTATRHVGLGLDRCFIREDTACANSENAAIVMLQIR